MQSGKVPPGNRSNSKHHVTYTLTFTRATLHRLLQELGQPLFDLSRWREGWMPETAGKHTDTAGQVFTDPMKNISQEKYLSVCVLAQQCKGMQQKTRLGSISCPPPLRLP